MDVLEQVQGGAPAAVEQFHVLGLDAQARRGGQPPHQGVELGQPARAERALVVQGGADLPAAARSSGVRVAQQPGERAQRVRHLRCPRIASRHGYTVALMGIVRFFSLPKRLVSDTPSLQPLPNEKPQPPRTLNAFSAYSRCVVGMTKRSS